MRSNSGAGLIAAVVIATAPAFLLLASSLLSVSWWLAPPGQKQISIYSSHANYSLPVIERNGLEYLSLFEALQPLGSVSAKADHSRWKLRYQNLEAEFSLGETRFRIQGRDLELAGKFFVENGRGLVPLNSLSLLLSQFLGAPIGFHQNSRRLFIDNVAVHFTAQITPSNPAALVMNFTSPVNPMIATEPGKLRMVFTHEPLVPPGSEILSFGSTTIPSASYSEDNGAAQIAISGTASLFASFSNDGRTITVSATTQPNPQIGSQRPWQPPPSLATLPVQSTAVPAGSNSAVPYFAVIDPSHGGEERGAALSDQLAEKDVTLAFARRIRQELENRGLASLLLRDADTTLTVDQRANSANTAHPAIYICIHAASEGTGVRLYTSLLPEGGENHGPFLDWNTAQAGFQSMSQTAAASLSTEFTRRQVPVRSLIAPLRPLNNVTAAAVALEISPSTGAASDFDAPAYQQTVAESLAAGLSAVREKLTGKP
jgi:N-acetylmuramoyl-L-alanine amidase